jgi:hypothetical protein
MTDERHVLTEDELVDYYCLQIRKRDELMLPHAARARAVEQARRLLAEGKAIVVREIDGTVNYWVTERRT